MPRPPSAALGAASPAAPRRVIEQTVLTASRLDLTGCAAADKRHIRDREVLDYCDVLGVRSVKGHGACNAAAVSTPHADPGGSDKLQSGYHCVKAPKTYSFD